MGTKAKRIHEKGVGAYSMITKILYDDKEGRWNSGPWCTEADYFAWIDVETFLPIFMMRGSLGALYCYVGVDECHPLYSLEFPAEEYKYIDVHGGIKFTFFSDLDSLHFSPAKRYWWIGFAGIAEGDLVPQVEKEKNKKNTGLIYRPFGYMEKQVTGLAHQLFQFDDRSLQQLNIKTDDYVE